MHENVCPNTTGYYCTALRSMDAFISLYFDLGGSPVPMGLGKTALLEEQLRRNIFAGQSATLDMVTSLGGNNE